MNRRDFLIKSGAAFFASSQLGAEMKPDRVVHHPSKAKNIIFLHMIGGPSQIDLFDHKPMLKKYAGKSLPESVIKDQKFAFVEPTSAALPPVWDFRQCGQNGSWISNALPHFQKVVDEVAVVRSMHTDEFNHGAAELFMHTGFGRLGRPSLGAWINYALGSENNNLPSYVVLGSGSGAASGNNTWGTGFLPGKFQGVKFRSGNSPVLYLDNPQTMHEDERATMISAVTDLNSLQFQESGNNEVLTRNAQLRMAHRMQTSIPDTLDIESEPEYIKEMYGIKNSKPSFARNCILARRLVEKGVRFIQLMDGGWDHHGNIKKSLKSKCTHIDQSMSALILDLKQRGLLDETLIVWGGEFGRTPMTQGSSGRDHHNSAFTMWMAGGGIKPGVNHGITDDFGFAPVEKGVHVHDLHATIMHLMGIDHTRLTYRYQGRDFRLTDVHGKIIKDLLS